MEEENKLDKADEAIGEENHLDLEKVIEDLKEKGLSNEQIMEAMANMVKEGKLAEEDLEKAKAILDGQQNEEKSEASKLFGVNIM